MNYRSSLDRPKKANITVDNIGAISGILKNLIKIDTTQRIDNAKSKVDDYYSSKRATNSARPSYTRRYTPQTYRPPSLNSYPKYEPPKKEEKPESDTSDVDQGFESDSSEESVETQVVQEECVTCQLLISKDPQEYILSISRSYRPVISSKCRASIVIAGKQKVPPKKGPRSQSNKGNTQAKTSQVQRKEKPKPLEKEPLSVVVDKKQEPKPTRKLEPKSNQAPEAKPINRKISRAKKITEKSATVAVTPQVASFIKKKTPVPKPAAAGPLEKKRGPFDVLLNHIPKKEPLLPEIRKSKRKDRTKQMQKPQEAKATQEQTAPESPTKLKQVNNGHKSRNKDQAEKLVSKKVPVVDAKPTRPSMMDKIFNSITGTTRSNKSREKCVVPTGGEPIEQVQNVSGPGDMKNTAYETNRGRTKGKSAQYQPPCIRRAEFLRRRSPNRKPVQKAKTAELEEMLLRPVRARSLSNVRCGDGTPWFDGFLKPTTKCEAEDTGKGEDNEYLKNMEEKKAGAADEMDEKLRLYEEQRQQEREREAEELRLLKEKQERRRAEREEEEQMLAQRIAEGEARRAAEEEEQRAKRQEEKNKREEERRKRQEAQEALRPTGTGANFTVEKKADGQSSFDKFGNIVKAKSEMGMTKDQREAHKAANLAKLMAASEMQVDGLDTSELKKRLKELHARLGKLEANKYDLEERDKRLTYDLKELNERQRQIFRNKAMSKGLNPDEVQGPHPPKVQVVSKYDRQVDRRNFRERKSVYDKKNSIPHFPNCPPPPTIMEKTILPGGGHAGGEDGGGEEGEYEEEYEEEEEE